MPRAPAPIRVRADLHAPGDFCPISTSRAPGTAKKAFEAAPPNSHQDGRRCVTIAGRRGRPFWPPLAELGRRWDRWTNSAHSLDLGKWRAKLAAV